jgi:alpha-beta hydrolase superfamily lysophospholipase
MVRPCLRWAWRHKKLSTSLVLLVLVLLLNLLAYLHAHAMTHYVRGGRRTSSPEQLTLWDKGWILLSGVTVPRPENQCSPVDVGLSFSIHRFPSSDGIELEAWLIDHPHPRGLVVLFHGYASCRAELLPEAKAFHELGYSTCLVDFRGSGGSTGNVTTIGVAEAEDIASAWTFVRKRHPEQRIILFGKSMGAAAVLRALSLGSVSPAAAVLECPFDRLLSTVENRFAAMNVPSFPLARLLVFWGGIQHGFNGFDHNPANYARKVNTPVLLLHGEDDRRVTRDQVEEIARNLSGPSELQFFPGIAHESYVAKNAERWKRCVGGFLSAHVPSP